MILWYIESLHMGLKPCPECAEQIQGAAKVCRYCGYRFDASAELVSVEGLHVSYPAWRFGGLLIYVALAWPLHPDVEGYSYAGNVAQGTALALTILAITGTGFWLGSKWKGRPKTWMRATLSAGAMLTALALAALALVGQGGEQEAAGGLPAAVIAIDRLYVYRSSVGQ